MSMLVKLISLSEKGPWHYGDVTMTTIASQITSLTVVYSIVYSGADQRKHQSSASLAFVRGIHRDRWIPRTKGQLRGKCFHLMTSSWYPGTTYATYATYGDLGDGSLTAEPIYESPYDLCVGQLDIDLNRFKGTASFKKQVGEETPDDVTTRRYSISFSMMSSVAQEH